MQSKLISFIRNEKTLILSSLILGLVFTIIFTIGSYVYATTVQNGISDEVLRLHVKAASDNATDQALKLLVKDAVLKSLEPELKFA